MPYFPILGKAIGIFANVVWRDPSHYSIYVDCFDPFVRGSIIVFMNKNFLIIGVIGLLALVGGGAVLMQKSGDTGAMPMSVSQGIAKIFNAECRYNDEELCKFMNNWKMPSEYSMRSTMTSKASPTSEFESRVKGEDSHVIMKEGGKVTHESMMIGGVDYIKDLSDGAWWKIAKEKAKDLPGDEMVESVDYDFTEKMEEVEDKTIYVRIGVEACGNLQCYKYQIVDPENKTTKEFIWFDDKDYLMQKTRSEEIGGDMSITEVVTTYENVTIAVPAPVKEGTALDAYGASSGMSKAEIAELKKQQLEAEKMGAEYMKSMNSGDMGGASGEMTWEAPPENVPQEETAY